MRILHLVFVFTILTSCVSKTSNHHVHQVQNTGCDSIKYAKGFTIRQVGNCKLVMVYNPWEGASGIVYKYVLCPIGHEVPDSLHGIPVIHTPVKKIVCLSTTHIALLAAIGRLNTLVGVAGPNFITDKAARQLIQDKKVLDIGFDQALNYELLVSLKPDLVLAYGIQGETATQYNKLEELGIQVVLNGEYLESTPLGKFEWIKFLAAFYGVSQEASEKFKTVEHEYLNMSKICDHLKDKPNVMTGLPWKGAWYIPGGESYIARLIQDAGGNYLWSDIHQRESVPLNFEKVIERGNGADFWINTGLSNSLNDILNEDTRLEKIKPFRDKNIYNNNAITNPTGGNDFWESGIVHPDIILKDLIKIFHPGILPNHKLVYYKKLN